MKAEKILISAVAMVIGVIVAGLIFYLYQSQKTLSQSAKIISIQAPTPTPKPTVFLTLDKPTDEDVVNNKTITVAGKTSPDATVVVTTDVDQDVVSPAQNGDFSTTVVISQGVNQIEITAIAPNGEESVIRRTITYSTEDF